MTSPRPGSNPDRHDAAQAPDDPERERREYPHGSGDRNSFSPFGKDRMPRHEGGTQRHAPPSPGSDAREDGYEGDEEGGRKGAPAR